MRESPAAAASRTVSTASRTLWTLSRTFASAESRTRCRTRSADSLSRLYDSLSGWYDSLSRQYGSHQDPVGRAPGASRLSVRTWSASPPGQHRLRPAVALDDLHLGRHGVLPRRRDHLEVRARC